MLISSKTSNLTLSLNRNSELTTNGSSNHDTSNLQQDHNYEDKYNNNIIIKCSFLCQYKSQGEHFQKNI